jgi:hypothetical protein
MPYEIIWVLLCLIQYVLKYVNNFGLHFIIFVIPCEIYGMTLI